MDGFAFTSAVHVTDAERAQFAERFVARLAADERVLSPSERDLVRRVVAELASSHGPEAAKAGAEAVGRVVGQRIVDQLGQAVTEHVVGSQAAVTAPREELRSESPSFPEPQQPLAPPPLFPWPPPSFPPPAPPPWPWPPSPMFPLRLSETDAETPDPFTSGLTGHLATSPQTFSITDIVTADEGAELLEWARDRIDDFVAETVVRPTVEESDRSETMNFATLRDLGEWRDRLPQRIHSKFAESSPSLRGSVDARLIMWEASEPLELPASTDGGPSYLILLDDADVMPVVRVYGTASYVDTVGSADEFLQAAAPINTAVVFPGAVTVVVQPASGENIAGRRFAVIGHVAPE